ncbi:MAG: nicotinate-nucleotide diphosphorylase (carboxylating), partial [Thermoplasmata archaeon]|nr:nicotinate-nucleotide diphosphorylase (carboxylating) [Thermoplasmata archaeon]
MAQADGVVSGIVVAQGIGRILGLRVTPRRRDGDVVHRGTVVLGLEGDLRAILRGERTLLNFLMHLSGVATATRSAVIAGRTGRGAA